MDTGLPGVATKPYGSRMYGCLGWWWLKRESAIVGGSFCRRFVMTTFSCALQHGRKHLGRVGQSRDQQTALKRWVSVDSPVQLAVVRKQFHALDSGALR